MYQPDGRTQPTRSTYVLFLLLSPSQIERDSPIASQGGVVARTYERPRGRSLPKWDRGDDVVSTRPPPPPRPASKLGLIGSGFSHQVLPYLGCFVYSHEVFRSMLSPPPCRKALWVTASQDSNRGDLEVRGEEGFGFSCPLSRHFLYRPPPPNPDGGRWVGLLLIICEKLTVVPGSTYILRISEERIVEHFGRTTANFCLGRSWCAMYIMRCFFFGRSHLEKRLRCPCNFARWFSPALSSNVTPTMPPPPLH